jgi:hypothetical protein
MFKSLIAFCLSRRAIVMVGLLLFAGAGLLLMSPAADSPGVKFCWMIR